MKKIGRNEPCPCGSGKKYKKCCLAANDAMLSFDQLDRENALEKIRSFSIEHLSEEEDMADSHFYAPFSEEVLDKLDDDWFEISAGFFDMWFLFDRPLANGRNVVDYFVEQVASLTAGEKQYLRTLNETVLRLYRVVDLLPGTSITLQDAINGKTVTVSERSASRTLTRHALIVARIMPRGASGKPEIEIGCAHLPAMSAARIIETFRTELIAEKTKHPDMTEKQCYKKLAPRLHEIWLSMVVNPPIPDIKNTDNEDLVWTTVRFDVLDAKQLVQVLNMLPDLEKPSMGGNEWNWLGSNRKGDRIFWGNLELRGDKLKLNTNSIERAARGRALIETSASQAVRYTTTTHTNVEAILKERLQNMGEATSGDISPRDEIPQEIKESIMLDHYAKYYRQWLDDSIPALEGHTPREAAEKKALRPKLIELVSGLEQIYETKLKEGEPAFDPSWMWEELDIPEKTTPPSNLPMAHERFGRMLEGFNELCHGIADRSRTSLEDTGTVITPQVVQSDLETHRFLRRQTQPSAEQASVSDGPSDIVADAPRDLLKVITQLANYELHLRKTFQVDPALAYLLAQTDADVPGSDLQMPFTSFALVFTDRHMLSLAERFLSIDTAHPLAGFILRVLTVYITECHGTDRVIQVTLMPDCLGADLPHPIFIELVVPDDSRLSRIVENALAKMSHLIPVASERLKDLLLLIINAILYATSAGPATEPVIKSPTGSGHLAKGPDMPATISDVVHYLPSPINITQVRHLQDLGRTKEGGQLLHRFLVRGHWRRPNPTWKDQSMRWIAPYWKGPDLAKIIERTYRLKP